MNRALALAHALVLAPLLVLCTLARPCVAGPEGYDRYYVVELMGKKSGHSHQMQRADGANIKTINEMVLEIKRGPITLKIEMSSEWTETADGKAISFSTRRALGAAPVEKTYLFRESDIALTTKSQGRTSETTLPIPPEGWLTPGASARLIDAALAKGEPAIVVKALDEGMAGGLQAATTTYTIVDRETTIEVLGKTVPAVKWSSTVDIMPGATSVEFVDAKGVSLRSEVDFGGMKLVQIAADKALALSPVEAPEFLVSTLVKPDKPIVKPRALTSAVYLLTVTEGEMPDLPTLASQTVERIDKQTICVSVRRDPAADAPAAPADPSALATSSMIDPTDKAITDLAKKALAGSTNKSPAEKAETLRRFVRTCIKSKNLDVGFATASEVARTKTGDCTEHGVLLAAVLRASGIPARVALGLEYVDNFAGKEGIFGYHMWSQALLPGKDGALRWIDLDATLDDATPFDAAHITIGVSNLAEGEDSNSLVTMAPLLGRLKITVEKTTP